MSRITYHKATQNDIRTLVDNRTLFALELGGEQPQEIIDSLKAQMTAYFTKTTSEGTCISFIAKCDNEVAGIGSVMMREQPGNFKNPSGKWGYIMNMYTVPEFRRKGICKGILNALVEDALKAGITAFELHATKEGELVYAQNGFELFAEPTYRKYTS
jgi:predicted acetyltransferase